MAAACGDSFGRSAITVDVHVEPPRTRRRAPRRGAPQQLEAVRALNAGSLSGK
jgi:hypothetical protein